MIGAGGGRDVLSALAFGARSVTAVEINKDIIRHGERPLRRFHRPPRPRSPRSHSSTTKRAASSPGRRSAIGTIQISLIDTWAATAAGAFVLGENSLYTVEAWTNFLGHLTDDGLLTVSRWYFHDRPAEMYRTTTIAVEALRSLGVTDPRRHIVIVRNMRPTTASTTETPDGVGTILVSRQPFSDVELDTLDKETSRLQFDVPFSPRVALDETFVQLTTPEGLPSSRVSAQLSRSTSRRRPTTVRSFSTCCDCATSVRTSLLDFGKLSHNMKAVATLGDPARDGDRPDRLCILLPLWMTRDRVSLSGVGPLFTFFIAIGLGFMLIETSQMQRLIIALGHPTYGLSVVLFALLLSSGIGSFLTQSVTANTAAGGGPTSPVGARRWSSRRLARSRRLSCDWIEPMTTARPNPGGGAAAVSGRAVHGDGVPARHEAGVGRARELTPWFWGLNGAASVLASVLERVHCADVVDLDRVLDGMGVLPGRAVAFVRAARPAAGAAASVHPMAAS